MKIFIYTLTALLIGATYTLAEEFTSPAAEASYRQSGDVCAMPDMHNDVEAILLGDDAIYLAARSSGCSSGCSRSCSSGCSRSCSVRCGGGSRTTHYTPSISTPKKTYTPPKTTAPKKPVSNISHKKHTPHTPVPAVPKGAGKKEYWVTKEGIIHAPSCDQYKKGEGELTTKPEGVNCKSCGGKPLKVYWVTENGVIHNSGCSLYNKGEGELTTKPEGTNCKECGGKH